MPNNIVKALKRKEVNNETTIIFLANNCYLFPIAFEIKILVVEERPLINIEKNKLIDSLNMQNEDLKREKKSLSRTIEELNAK